MNLPKTNKPLRAVIYARVSTVQQGEGTSLAGQTAACLVRAKTEGALPIALIEETKSGGLYASRGELQKALALIESGEAQMLILSRLDRTGREVESLRDVRRRVEAAGAKLIFADGMTFEKGAVGNLLFTQLAGFAEFERELIRERMVAGLERVAASGKQPSRAQRPYGYRIWQKADAVRGHCTPEEVGTYSVVEEEARWIKPVFERLAAFESLRSVAAWLHRQGAPTRSGRPWNPATLALMVRNEVYIGRPAWRKTKRIVDETRSQMGVGIDWEQARPREEWVVLSAPALVEQSLFEQARELVMTSRAQRSGRNDARYLLTGLTSCPHCGRRMNAAPSCSGKKRIHLYRCSGAVRRQKETSRPCEFPSIIGGRLDALVVEALTELLQSPTIRDVAVAEFRASQKTKARQTNEEARLQHLEREIEMCHKREEIAARKEIEAAMNGQDENAFAQLRLQSEERRTLAQRERDVLTTRRDIGELQVAPVKADVAQRLVEALHDAVLPDAQKGLLLRPFVLAVYPRLVPPELRVSAKVWRERGCPETIEADGGHPFSRYVGGCDIVLRLGNDNAVFILSRHLTGWKPIQKSRRRALEGVWNTSLHIEEQNPFPREWKRTSTAETRAYKRGN